MKPTNQDLYDQWFDEFISQYTKPSKPEATLKNNVTHKLKVLNDETVELPKNMVLTPEFQKRFQDDIVQADKDSRHLLFNQGITGLDYPIDTIQTKIQGPTRQDDINKVFSELAERKRQLELFESQLRDVYKQQVEL